MKRLLIVLMMCVVYWLPALTQTKQVEIPGSQVQLITSKIVNQQYVLHISLPSGYDKSNKKYPVLYLLDGQWDFPLATALYGQQYFDGFIPEMIIAGITWGGSNPNPDSLRARDYTPTNEKRLVQSGGAPKFLSFLKQELIPYVESNYKASGDRTLMGCSLGGLFTLYTLFTQPTLFQRYVAASPAYGWDNEVIYQYEKTYFENKSASPVKLYMSMGGVERGLPGFEKLVKHLNSRSYSVLTMKTRVLENTGHSGTKGEGYARGLQYVFERPSIQLSKALMDQYTGSYQDSNGNKLEIKKQDNRLALYAGNGAAYPLFAASDTELYTTSEFLHIRFNMQNAKVTGFQLERYGRSEFVQKAR